MAVTHFFASAGGKIKQWGLNDGAATTPKAIYPSASVSAQYIFDKDNAGNPINPRVAIKNLSYGMVQTTGEYILQPVDPTTISVNGVACADAAAFMAWFYTA